MHRRPEDENLIQYQQGHSGLHCQEMPAPLFHNKSFQTMKLNYFFSILGGFLFHWREAIPLQQHLFVGPGHSNAASSGPFFLL